MVIWDVMMPKARSTIPKPSRTKSPSTHKCSANVGSAARARLLVDALLCEMQEGVRNPSYRESEAWEKLFGSKDSLVMNLQKLVATLMALPDDAVKVEEGAASPEAAPITPEEMVLLKAWLEDGKSG